MEQLRAKVKLLPRAGRIYYTIAMGERTMDTRGGVPRARGDSATTCASVRKDVPLRSSISPFDDRALEVLQLTSHVHTYTPS